MANTLKDDMKADFAALMLNTDEFAETVTFYPANGDASRQIVMHVSRVQNAEDGVYVQSDSDTLIVRALKDSSHAKGGIPIEELERSLRPTLWRASDFNWSQHATDQIDDRLVASPTGTYKNLFDPAYSNGQANTWNPSCWAVDFDFSGVSMYNAEASKEAGTLVSPRHVVFTELTHNRPSVGTDLLFVDNTGAEVTIALEAVVDLVDIGYDVPVYENDIGVGYLAEDIPSGVTFYKVLPDDYATYLSMTNLPLVYQDQEQKVMVAECRLAEMGWDHLFFKSAVGNRASYYEDLVGGDSGYPTFMALDRELIFLATTLQRSSSTSYRGQIVSYVDSSIATKSTMIGINAAMTQSTTAGDTVYQLTEFDLARPRYVFTGDILGETPHNWTLRFVRQKSHRTGGGTGRR